MSKSISQAEGERGRIVKLLAWLGIIFAGVAIGLAVIELVSPSQIGNKIVNPLLFQIENVLFPLSFLGWVLICFAFYLSGATKRGWLPRTALALAILGAIVGSFQSLVSAVTIRNVDLPDWAGIIQFGLVLFSPILLGIAALRTRTISLWQALYPIIIVAIVSIAFWGIFAETNPSVPIMVQAVAWIGFGILAMAVKPGKA